MPELELDTVMEDRDGDEDEDDEDEDDEDEEEEEEEESEPAEKETEIKEAKDPPDKSFTKEVKIVSVNCSTAASRTDINDLQSPQIILETSIATQRSEASSSNVS